MGKNLPKIGITMGDPAGVGPEIIVKALSDDAILETCIPLVIGDERILSAQAKDLGIDGNINSINAPNELGRCEFIQVLSLTKLENINKGKVSAEAGHASGLYIEKAVELAMNGTLDGLVTAPINKEAFNKGGFLYPGHTEFLAELTGTEDFAMMLMGRTLKVVLLTIHCPLMEVSKRLTAKETIRIIRLTHRALRDHFDIKAPRLALASLNPHAGEGGLLGNEETELLIPAAEAARNEGINITDPMPSDTLFYKAVRGRYDAVICPYHDQALIPLKLLHFDEGVNVTLGLPFIRTSPDHGTAFDIAGKGIADPTSLKAAIEVAVNVANKTMVQ